MNKLKTLTKIFLPIVGLSTPLICFSTACNNAKYIEIKYQGEANIKCDPYEDQSISWHLSATAYPLKSDQSFVWSIENDTTPNKKVYIDEKNMTINWHAIGVPNDSYSFDLVVKWKNDPNISARKTFYIITDSGQRNPDQDYYDYIDNRTFSLSAWGSNNLANWSISSGTIWIYKRLSDNDYTYEFFTNYHVMAGIASISSFPFHTLGILTNNTADQITYEEDTLFDLNYSLNSLEPIVVKAATYKDKDCYMDMCAFKLDLSSVYETAKQIPDEETTAQFVKKIDYINQNYQKGQNVVEFSQTNLNLGDDVYIAGYPWNNSYEDDPDREWTRFTKVHDKVNELKSFKIFDIGDDANYMTIQETGWLPQNKKFELGGGASGSMVINKDYQVVGIYWGGAGPRDLSYFIPSFALFNLTIDELSINFIDIVNQKLSSI